MERLVKRLREELDSTAPVLVVFNPQKISGLSFSSLVLK